MKQYIQHDEWLIIEEGFDAHLNKVSESLFSIGNGKTGQRANFEEDYSGESLRGSYVAGVYYPDKTKVGWWKNGYPEYFAKVLNAPNWIGIKIAFDGEILDLAKAKVTHFRRILNMKEGYLERNFRAELPSGKVVDVSSIRFLSIAQSEVGAIRYSITPVNFKGNMTVEPYVDADVHNQDANWEEQFWQPVSVEVKRRSAMVIADTKKTNFRVATGMHFSIFQNGGEVEFKSKKVKTEKYAGCQVVLPVQKGEETTIYKYAAIVSSLNYTSGQIEAACESAVKNAAKKGFTSLRKEQAKAWAAKWEEADIRIEGDVAAQQGIRFNIFQLYQTYTGEDERLNIGPKGFTGEKYGGSTYWDTEAYCLPFYLATADSQVAKNLVLYRYKQLDKAIENAAKLGFTGGAALFPMVTMNGEECHNEWEITFEEIHRNGAIAFGVYDYIRYTGDQPYLVEYGLELLIAISRFWAQRVHWSDLRQMYVMHGVTGPNEYENNINNNWYTNYFAVWCLKYTMESIEYVKAQAPQKFQQLCTRIAFDEGEETSKWASIQAKMYFPYDDSRGVFVQHDGFLDKELMPVALLPDAQRPLNQKWSWDRILRSCFIKQADVLQGLYFFNDQFDEGTIRRNFDFYEPMTVHESSLSPCVHAILAAQLGKDEKAYEMYARSARLDLDDYNNDTEDGCHTTSMAGTWMAVIKGFGGMKISNGMLSFNPMLPSAWTGFSFKIRFRGVIVQVSVSQSGIIIANQSKSAVTLQVYGMEYSLNGKTQIETDLRK